MVLTVTPNPSVDRTLHVGALAPGQVIRAREVSVEAAGKGINVAMATAANGGDATAVYPVGGADAERFAGALGSAGVKGVAVPIRGDLRHNATIVADDGSVTKVNEPGPCLSSDEADALVAALLGADDGRGWVVASGSVPPGAGDDFMARLAEALPDAARRLAIDTSGAALRCAADAEFALLKPNLDELRSLAETGLDDLAGVADAAHRLRRPGSAILVSLGAAGALLADDDGTLYAESAPAAVRNTVGAGDALLAGFLAAGGRGPDALRNAVAWASAAVASARSVGQAVEDCDRASVVLHISLPRSRRLEECA